MWRKIGFVLGVALLAGGLSLPALAESSDPLVGTWHVRDGGFSNSFIFVDDPIGGVFHIQYYDDHTAEPACGDNGPHLWTGYTKKTDPNTLEGSFGTYWCFDNGDGEISENHAGLAERFPLTITYDPDTDTLVGDCVGTRQPHIQSVAKAIHEVEKGKFPPSGIFAGCNP